MVRADFGCFGIRVQAGLSKRHPWLPLGRWPEPGSVEQTAFQEVFRYVVSEYKLIIQAQLHACPKEDPTILTASNCRHLSKCCLIKASQHMGGLTALGSFRHMHMHACTYMHLHAHWHSYVPSAAYAYIPIPAWCYINHTIDHVVIEHGIMPILHTL